MDDGVVVVGVGCRPGATASTLLRWFASTPISAATYREKVARLHEELNWPALTRIVPRGVV